MGQTPSNGKKSSKKSSWKEEVKAILLKLKRKTEAEIVESGKKSKKALKESSTTSTDETAYITTDVDVDLSHRNSERKKTLLKVEEALQNLKEGKYGICDECSEKIPAKRLAILPFAVKCVECEGEAERTKKRTTLIQL